MIEYLNKLHPNIHVMGHPHFTPITWSHHQKFGTSYTKETSDRLVVVDDEVAFVGGIDMCYNRYDDSRYLITGWEVGVEETYSVQIQTRLFSLGGTTATSH